jgi:hypothetical protein
VIWNILQVIASYSTDLPTIVCPRKASPEADIALHAHSAGPSSPRSQFLNFLCQRQLLLSGTFLPYNFSSTFREDGDDGDDEDDEDVVDADDVVDDDDDDDVDNMGKRPPLLLPAYGFCRPRSTVGLRC